jgi:membrane-bound serine protease (ClpP class)
VSGIHAMGIALRHISRWLLAGLLIGNLVSAQNTQVAAPAERFATLIELNGAIGPAMSSYVVRSLDEADRRQSAVVVLQIDTPGGLDASMRDIIKAILASAVPVVSYVAPSGARAASAGTYILYASHLAAMAPATNLGAATPVAIGAESSSRPTTPAQSQSDDRKPPGQEEIPAGASEHKAVNDAVGYIRALAQLRGRNADWAESAVRSAASLSADDALQQHVIDVIAKDVPDLLHQINGRKLKVGPQELVLDTQGLALHRIMPDWRTRLLLVLSHPILAYGLLLIGIYGLLLEGYNPGAVLPGVVGALSLLLALYALQLLAVNYAGLALIALGIGLIITEFFMPAFGSLGVGGLAAFVIGSMLLFDSPVPELRVALPVIAGIAIAGGLVIVIIAWLADRARRRPVSTGVEAMLGASVTAINDFQDEGVVRFGGEIWNARTSSPMRARQQARIVKVEGLTLLVEPQSDPQE